MTDCPIRLIVGLNNPGSQYKHTRHNAGAWFVDHLTEKHVLQFKLNKAFKGSIARLQVAKLDADCYILLPDTFMNLSGAAVQAVMQFYKIKPEAILIAHDELDFLPGDIKFKQGGGHGGHNGLRDISQKIGNQYNRLRIGVGRPKTAQAVHDYVLSRPNNHDELLISDCLKKTVDYLPDLLAGNISAVMKALNTRTK